MTLSDMWTCGGFHGSPVSKDQVSQSWSESLHCLLSWFKPLTHATLSSVVNEWRHLVQGSPWKFVLLSVNALCQNNTYMFAIHRRNMFTISVGFLSKNVIILHTSVIVHCFMMTNIFVVMSHLLTFISTRFRLLWMYCIPPVALCL